MRSLFFRAVLGATLILSIPVAGSGQESGQRGVELGDLTWIEAEEVLGPEAIVVLPLGAASKEHGPHLRLDNDLQMAEYLKRRVLEASDVVVAPTVSYHFYPSFLEYPGSTHLTFETARDVVVDIVRSLAGYGPRRFYVLNTGVSTIRPLEASAERLRAEGILLQFTDILEVAGPAEDQVREQVRGTHADEIETSMMLYVAPDRVDMARAVREDNARGEGGLTRRPDGEGTYSESGVWGDATLATVEKGRIVVEATVEGILQDIDELRAADLPNPGLIPCDSPGADPWTRESRDGLLAFDEVVHYGVELFGPPDSCGGMVETEFNGQKFGLLRLGFSDGATFLLQTMPPETGIITLRVPSGFEDEEAALDVLKAHTARVGVEIDWANPETTAEGNESVTSFWDPDDGLNARASLIYQGGKLVALRFSLAL
jgi:creatinine amidohydrolase